jgi:hypothetical protein
MATRPFAWPILATISLAASTAIPQTATADEGGVSFWLAGLFGSLAAAPQQPGWSFADIYYHGHSDSSCSD